MKRIQVEKAAPAYTGQAVEDVEITVHQSIDLDAMTLSDDDYLPRLLEVFRSDAQSLFEAMRSSLPGGTFDQLLGLMLAHKSSHFIVSHRE